MTAHVSPPIRLTRRDRKAMELALECARHFPAPLYRSQKEVDAESACLEAFDHLTVRPYEYAIGRGLIVHALDGYEAKATGKKRWRLLRARLSLLIRAVLRADAGDLGRHEWEVSCTTHGVIGRTFSPRWHMYCDRCGREWQERDRWSKASGDAYQWGGRTFRIVGALWEQARRVTP